MFRHSEIQAIIRKRRHLRDNGENGSEDGEAVESVVEEAAETDSLSTPTTVPDVGKVASGRVEKPKIQQWATSSESTKRRNRKHRDRYQAKKKAEKFKREQTRKSIREEDDESDEWDPWHQAKGPDVQKDDTVDLDY